MFLGRGAIKLGCAAGYLGGALLGVLLGISVAVGPAHAQDLGSPVGEWRTIDDNTGKPRAVVKIFERSGLLYGIVERPLEEHPQITKCDACEDDRRGKTILGMEIIRGLHADGDQWDGGTILDPETGKVYRCKLSLKDGGRRLAVRGYLGISLLGRTQTWERVS
jgi:uncharacterized protein (DUF2147 family)